MEKPSTFGLDEKRGHILLASSLLQRCWPQQSALNDWLMGDSGQGSLKSSLEPAWFQWSGWKANNDDEDILNLAIHLTLCGLGENTDRIKLLTTVGSDLLDSTYRVKTTALHSASSTGRIEEVKLLLAAGASADVVIRGRTPLHIAAGKGYSEIVEALLLAGASVSATTSSGRTALINAATRGSVSTVKSILQWILKSSSSGTPASIVDTSQTDTGRTPLSVVAEEGYDKIIRLLLNAKASVYLSDRWGRSPVYYAARYGRVGADVLRDMIRAPRGQECLGWGECRHNRSPLHEAVWHGHLEIVQVLLDCNADPNLVEGDGGSPLHEAAYFGSYGLGEERRRRNHGSTKRKVRLDNDQTPGEPADSEAARFQILQLLLNSRNCKINLGESHGCTPLWYAAGGGWTEAAGALIDAGANVNPTGVIRLTDEVRNSPASPLLYAIERGHYNTAKVLFHRGAQIPPSCDITEFCSRHPKLPEELVNCLLEDQQKDAASVDVVQRQGGGIVGFGNSTMCSNLPVDTFAQPAHAPTT